MAIGHDIPNWRALNACAPCSYELNGEPPLKFTRMYVMDGGNSAKRMMGIGDRQCGDTRVYTESDYKLPRTFVDCFTNEVLQSHSAHQHDRPDDDVISDAEEDVPRAHIAEDCSKNWKAAADDDKKRMWAIFDETGIFVAACRHGFILWYADMIKSGELYVIFVIVVTYDTDSLQSEVSVGDCRQSPQSHWRAHTWCL
jgi:hypothetical protein